MAVTNLFHKPLHFEFYVAVVLINELFDQYLNFRQYRFIKRQLEDGGSLPNTGKEHDANFKKTHEAVKVYLKSESYTKTLEYSYDKLKFQIFSSIFHTALNLALLFALFLPKLWTFSGRLFRGESEYIHSLVFCGIKMLVDLVVDLPFGLYSDFVIEEKHGFNKKTLRLFVKDTLISLALYCIIGPPVLVALIFLVNWGGDVFGFLVVFTFVMMVIYPELIQPLFNKFEPLKDEALRTDIEDLVGRTQPQAKQLKFPLREIKQMDGSKRSSHSNAYLYGLWKFKRVVVFDTLLKFDRKQVVAVVGHEFGHWKKHHFPKMVTLTFANMFFMFYVFKTFKDDQNMFNSFGFYGVKAFVIGRRGPAAGITLFSNIFTLVGLLTNLLVIALTRRHEYEADRFAVSLGLGEDLANSLLSLSRENKSMIAYDPLYSWYHFTHPVLFERLHAIYAAIEKTK